MRPSTALVRRSALASLLLACSISLAQTPDPDGRATAAERAAAGIGAAVTPLPGSPSNLAQNASLANYVVAHSEFSGPISRRMALLGILASENGGTAAQPAPADAGAEATDAP